MIYPSAFVKLYTYNEIMEQDLDNIEPLYFIEKKQKGVATISDYDVCMATTKHIDKKNLKGVQKIGSLWRIYIGPKSERAKLAVTGIDIKSMHINLDTTNPFTFQTSDGKRPIKIYINGVKMKYTNTYIEDYLKGLGVKLVSPVKYCKVRDNDNKDTDFYNGDRFTFAEATHLGNKPLQPWLLIGECVARIKHYGQSPFDSTCAKCLETSHPTFKCKNDRVCKICKKTGHFEGTSACQFYVEDNDTRPFGGRNDPLSNFHPCEFEYKGIAYANREQCIQHQKAITSNATDVADAIHKTTDPGQVKTLSKCIGNKEVWKKIEDEVYEDLCYHAALQNEEYKDTLIDSGETILIEAVNNQFKWGSGVNVYVTKHTRYDKLPGMNKMAKIHMKVRDRLVDEDNTYKKQRQSTPMTKSTVTELEMSIDNKFQTYGAPPEDKTSEPKHETPNSSKGKRPPSRSPGEGNDQRPLKHIRSGPSPNTEQDNLKHSHSHRRQLPTTPPSELQQIQEGGIEEVFEDATKPESVSIKTDT